MSRTIRRKNYLAEEYQYTRFWDYNAVPWPGNWKSYERGSKEYKKGWWKYHNDTSRPMNSIPKCYRKIGESEYKSRMKQQLSNWEKDPDYPIQDVWGDKHWIYMWF